MTRAAWCLSVCVAMAAAACVTPKIPPGLSASFTPNERQVSKDFASEFCSIIEYEFPEFKPCANYLRLESPPQLHQLDRIPDDWMLARLGGFGAECFKDIADAFEDAGKHLESAHHIQHRRLSVGAFESSEKNAELVTNYIHDELGQYRVIVVAHSKGAADMMVALTNYPDRLSNVEALITVAGAVGGSHLVDRLDALNKTLLKDLNTACPATLTANRQNGIDSMRRDNRQKFLAEHEHIKTPAFSISAVSDSRHTSRMLHGLWERLTPYATEQDSHILEREAIVPGGVFLGRALGDHWAVAMPFKPSFQINHNVYPRAALVEAAVRIAIKQTRGQKR